MKNFFGRAFGALFALLLTASIAAAQFTDQRVWGGTSGGSANAQTLTIPNMGSYLTGVPIRALAGFTNSSTTTLVINGLAVKNVFKPSAGGAVVLAGGEIIAGQLFEVVYDGTQFQLTANNAQSAAVRTAPQGYLTPCQLTAGSPVSGCTAGQLLPTGDVSAATVLYYEPLFGNQLPIYNGSNMIMTSFAELTLTIPSSRLANTIYDVCVFLNSGVVTAAIGPAWSTSTAGGGARGTGAGTAQISQVQGVWTNAVSISAVNGGSTFTVPANQCTTVATLLIDGTNGQVTFHRTYGQSRKWAAWNFYNQLKIELLVGDGTASWTYTSATPRPANNSSANSCTLLNGLPDSLAIIHRLEKVNPNQDITATIGVGWNSTSAFSGTPAAFTVGGAANAVGTSSIAGRYLPIPFIGSNVATSLESASGSSATFFGTQTNMLMTCEWRG